MTYYNMGVKHNVAQTMPYFLMDGVAIRLGGFGVPGLGVARLGVRA